ncbi:Phosphoribosylformylglycinamidine synthase subunit PurL [Candidatus Methanoperedenaceae archaeon GB50]|nr:Phosphoribosylformylglycinamidine synthase subunit PurL [Candidatus Methanoperedenaceae archaeon GB50]
MILIGETRPELGGSEYYHNLKVSTGSVPTVPADIDRRLRTIRRVIRTGNVTTAHDVSNGGLGAALSEMITPTNGAEITLIDNGLSETELLFSETHGRMLITTPRVDEVLRDLEGIPHAKIGTTTREPQLEITTRRRGITLTFEEIDDARERLTRIMRE